MPVTAHLLPGGEQFARERSSALVLHLHGNLCVRTSEYEARRKTGEALAWLEKPVEPLFSFDASSISAFVTSPTPEQGVLEGRPPKLLRPNCDEMWLEGE